MIWNNLFTKYDKGSGESDGLALCIVCVVLILIACVGWLIDAGATPHTDVNTVGLIVNTSLCTVLSCTDTVCIYEGVLVLAYDYDDVAYETAAPPQSVCSDDCCTSLMVDATPIGVVFFEEQPDLIAYFTLDVSEPTYKGNFVWAAILLILVFAGICGLAMFCIERC